MINTTTITTIPVIAFKPNLLFEFSILGV
jgi:hypothetical protein